MEKSCPFTLAAQDRLSQYTVGALIRSANAAYLAKDTAHELRCLNRALAAVQAHPVVCTMTRQEQHAALLRVRDLAPVA